MESDSSNKGGKPPECTEMTGKTVALEVIAMTALALALDGSTEENRRKSFDILDSVVATVESRCRELGFGAETSESTERYVRELVTMAKQSLLRSMH
jgi:hypothetical protein